MDGSFIDLNRNGRSLLVGLRAGVYALFELNRNGRSTYIDGFYQTKVIAQIIINQYINSEEKVCRSAHLLDLCKCYKGLVS